MTTKGTEAIDTTIRDFLQTSGSPRLMEEICEHVAGEVGCHLTEVERRVVAISDIEQRGRLWWFSDGEVSSDPQSLSG